MKILVVGDVHWSQYSSILRKRGNKYSYRLENLIKSINWVEELAIKSDCEIIVYLGDFFDRPDINSEELSALKEILWANMPHYFLVGNHEIGRQDLFYNSTNIFGMANFEVIDSVKPLYIDNSDRLVFIPYILEENRLSLQEYFKSFNDYNYSVRKTIIFSHNDIKGFAMGKFISQSGFDIEDIDKNCDLYLNGHLHNSSDVTEKIINVGNITGQNFSEDAFKYEHHVIILDTTFGSYITYNNPYALNFYKLDFTKNNNIDYINKISMDMKNNCIITVKCNESDSEYLKYRFDPNYKNDIVPHNCNIIESKFIIQSDFIDYKNNEEEIISIDHLEQFKNYMVNLIGNNEILYQELQEICR